MIHVVDGLTDKILAVIDEGEFWDDVHYKSLRDTMETYDFSTFGDRPFAQHLGKRNRLVIPDEDGKYVEFLIGDTRKYRSGYEAIYADVKSNATYLDLRKSKVISPGKLESQTLSTLVTHAIGGTEWQAGRLEGAGIRTINTEKHTDPYTFLKSLATEYDLELQFRTEISGNRVVGRYVDLLRRVGDWRGREIVFGADLVEIERNENTDDIVTALVGIGPERDDGTRLEVTVSDSDAWQRWGRVDPQTGQRSHIIETYEPQSSDQDMTEERLRTLTENELEKRVNAIVEYTAKAADLEYIPGMEGHKMRFGDSIRVKDEAFEPPIYLDARLHTQKRSLSDPSLKEVTLGDFIEYTEEDINAIWASLQLEIQRRLAGLMVVTVKSSAGDVFKNGVGTSDLTAELFLSGGKIDEDGSFYTYSWTKHDKDGIRDMSFARSGKTITVSSADVDTKATFFVDIAYNGEVLNAGQFTLADLYDGEDGQDGTSLYTWVKYADDANGNGMSDSPVGKEYIGFAYNKTTSTESTVATDYSWAKIQGDRGVQGPPGSDGTPRYTWIKYADSATGSGMSDSPTGKEYIGLAHNKTTATESSTASDYTWSKFVGPQGPQGVQGPPGEDGTPRYTWVKYADTSTGGGMSDSPTGKKYIGLAYNKTSATESSTASDYTWALIQGPQGIEGPPGDDGQSLYTWLKYADSPTSGMSDSPSGKAYMGIAYNKTSASESTSYSAYTWSKIEGPTGPTGPRGPQGPNIVDSTTEIEANVIKSNHIDVSNLSAIIADLGTVTAGSLVGVSLTSDNGLGSKVVLNDGVLQTFRSGKQVLRADEDGLRLYDNVGAIVGNIRDGYQSDGDPGLDIHSYNSHLVLGFKSTGGSAKTWMEFDYDDRATYLYGSNRPGYDDGDLVFKSTKEGGTANGHVPELRIFNHTDSGGTRWSNILALTGRDNLSPANIHRTGFEVWQYEGTGDGASKLMFRTDTYDAGWDYFEMFTDRAYLPMKTLLKSESSGSFAAMGAAFEPEITSTHGSLEGNVSVWFGRTTITAGTYTNNYFGPQNFSFSGAENIFMVYAQPYNENSTYFNARIYNVSSTGFQIYLGNPANRDRSGTSIDINLMVIYEAD